MLILALNLMLHIIALDNFEEFAKVYTTVQKSFWKKFFESFLKQFDYDFDTVTQKLVLKFGPNEGLSFEDEEVPSILGFKGIRDISNHGFIHIGYKSEKAGNSLSRHVGDFPVDITCGSQLIFVYIDIIEHQNVGDVRAPVKKKSLILKDV